jgi:hypothetical protein
MSLEMVHLRKLLKIFYLEPRQQTSELRADIRQDIARDSRQVGGGDFHAPFWRDARDHVFNAGDLYQAVESRIESNAGRERLYPILRDGFLRWWNERRRWTNEPFEPIEAPHARVVLEGLGTVKVENLLAVRDAAGGNHFIYPYFAEQPALSEEAGRLGLWLLDRAFPAIPAEDLRVLDVIRGNTSALDRTPLQGDEESVFRRRYGTLLSRWQSLWEEYE